MSRIMVAGGGGGANYFDSYYKAIGGDAGGLNSYPSSGQGTSNYLSSAPISNQVGGYKFGEGQSVVTNGGGGGYYGGKASSWTGGAGGSSYISGHNGSIAIQKKLVDGKVVPSSSSIHYSNYKFENTIMIDGRGYKIDGENKDLYEQIQPDGTVSSGHKGNGYARIKYLGKEKINYDNIPGRTWEFGYTGSIQVLKIPAKGKYKIELWGAQGGNSNTKNDASGSTVYGGNGSYVKGEINLLKDKILYIYVGGKGTDGGTLTNVVPTGGYNGGGNGSSGYNRTTEITGGAGGGATDVRLESKNGDWSDFDSLKSRIMVAAGGAGRNSYTTHGEAVPGGALTGFNGTISTSVNIPLATGGTQISGGSAGGKTTGQASPHDNGVGTNGGFGFGGNSNFDHGSGAGSGYYGGGGGGWIAGNVSSAGSGSSYISGYTGCNSISVDSTEDNIIHTGDSVHYSKYKFEEAIMIDGNHQMPSPYNSNNIIGNTGNGYAKITYIGE